MRILLVADPSSPHIRPWVDAMRRRGHELAVFSAQKALPPEDLAVRVIAPLAPGGRPPSASRNAPSSFSGARSARGAGGPTGGWRLRTLSRALRLAPALRTTLKREAPDRVLALRFQPEAFLAALAGARPLIAMSWGQDILRYALGHPFHRVAARRVVDAAGLLIAETGAVATGLERLGAPPRKILRGWTGIDLDLWRAVGAEERAGARARLATRDERLGRWLVDGAAAGAPLLVSPRAFARQGHQLELFRAFVSLSALPATVRLATCGPGDPSIRAACVRTAEAAGAGPRLFDLGPLPHETLRDLLAVADVVASLWSPDGLSQVLLESMASGCFPIAADLPGNREWIADGETGFLVDPVREDRIRAALERALGDPGLRAAAAARNRSRVEADADRRRNMDRLVDSVEAFEGMRS